MSDEQKRWEGETVRKWLASRLAAARADQDAADRQGRDRSDDYDKAAAEECVCQLTKTSDATNEQLRFTDMLKDLLDRDEYRWSGVHDDKRFEREVRSYLRKLLKMTKANTGFENTSRYQ